MIAAETMVFEEGKYYPVLLACNVSHPENAALIQRARQRERLLEKRMEEAGFSEAERREAGEWLGCQLMAEMCIRDRSRPAYHTPKMRG